MNAARDAAPVALEPQRVLDQLRELRSLTATPRGAQRVAWTPTWTAARSLLVREAEALGLAVHTDRACNLWAVAEGESDEVVVLGSHLDSVPDGGWLDGALGVFAALEVVRALLRDGRPRRTLAIVDWADEEGARFGRSLIGSSAFAGTLGAPDLAALTDADGASASEVTAAHGLRLEELGAPDPLAERIAAYLELHIEQGPVLERLGLAAAAVRGTIGIERDHLIFTGQSAHAGPTPMELRSDALLAAAEVALAAEGAAIAAAGRATCGRLESVPGIPTAVSGEAVLSVDLRHEDAAALKRLRTVVLDAARAAAEARGCQVRRERIWHIEPRPFDERLVDAAADAVQAVTGARTVLTSGALHDAGEMALLAPTAMIFCASRGGLSHCVEEDSAHDDLVAAIVALHRLARTALEAPDAR